jgi:hypothetical protein
MELKLPVEITEDYLSDPYPIPSPNGEGIFI